MKKVSRRKTGYPATAFDRMRIPRDYFGKSSFIPGFFGLSSSQTDYLFDNANQHLKAQLLLLLDVWDQVSLQDYSRKDVTERLRRHIKFDE